MKRIKRIIFWFFVINISVYITVLFFSNDEIVYSGTFVKGAVENRYLY